MLQQWIDESEGEDKDSGRITYDIKCVIFVWKIICFYKWVKFCFKWIEKRRVWHHLDRWGQEPVV
jgi:hypothetical protein